MLNDTFLIKQNAKRTKRNAKTKNKNRVVKQIKLRQDGQGPVEVLAKTKSIVINDTTKHKFKTGHRPDLNLYFSAELR